MQIKPLQLAVLWLLIAVIGLGASGCWDYREVDETAYILVLGLDQGRENKLTLTAQIAVPRRMGGQAGGMPGGAEQNPSEVISVEAPSFSTGLDMLNTFINRQLSLKHTKAVIFSEPLAREGMLKYLEVMGRFPEFRRSVYVAVSRGVTAKELLEKNRPVMEVNPSKYVELAVLASRWTGFSALRPQYHFFYNAIKSQGTDPIADLVGLKRKTPQGKGPPAPAPPAWRLGGAYYAGQLPRSGGNEVEIVGAALFKEDKLVGELNADEIAALAILKNIFEQGYYTIPDPLAPNLATAINLHQHRGTKIKVDVSEPIPRIFIKVALDGNVAGIQSDIDYESPALRPRLEQATAKKVKQDIAVLLHKTQSLGVDAAWLGERAKVHFWTQAQWENYQWRRVYPQAEINVEVKVDLRGFGLVRETRPRSPG